MKSKKVFFRLDAKTQTCFSNQKNKEIKFILLLLSSLNITTLSKIIWAFLFLPLFG